jgi:hypothetical protein
MKIAFLGLISALLVGVSTFGVYKSVDLSRKNGELEVSLKNAQEELSITKKSLSENRAARIQMEEDLNVMQIKMDQKEKEAKDHLRQIAELTKKTGEVEQTDAAMASIYNAMSDQIMRLEFENAEMRRKLSSVHELKKAIKNAQIQRHKVIVRSKKAVVKKEIKQRKVLKKPSRMSLFQPTIAPAVIPAPVTNEIAPQKETRNEGYLIRDGKSTFEGVVEINVTPAEANVL